MPDPLPAPAPQMLTRPRAPTIAYHLLPAAGEKRQEDAGARRNLPGVIFLTGFNSTMNGTKATALEQFCRERRQGFLRFDYSGHGESGGEFRDGTIGAWLQDTLDVFDRLTAGPQIVVGSSMGGWIALLLALQRGQRIAGLVGLAAALDFVEEIWRHFSQAEQETLMTHGLVERPSAYSDSPYMITRALIEDGRRHLLLGGAINITCPVRLIHGMADPDVPYQGSLQVAERLRSDDATVTLIKDGDHRLSRPQDLQRLFEVVSELSDRGDA
jgi:pimeloyl-ACP methyl ester carboxylesterase